MTDTAAPREVLEATMKAMQCSRVHDTNTSVWYWYCDRHQFGWLTDRDCCPHAEVAADAAYTATRALTPDPVGQTCGDCGCVRTVYDVYDYSPLQVVTGAPLGWYSGDDGEICGECMTRILRNQ